MNCKTEAMVTPQMRKQIELEVSKILPPFAVNFAKSCVPSDGVCCFFHHSFIKQHLPRVINSSANPSPSPFEPTSAAPIQSARSP